MLHVLLALIVTQVDPTVITTSDRRANLKLFADGAGHFIAMTTLNDGDDEFYYGDSKVFYRMEPFAVSGSGSSWSWTLRDPRYMAPNNYATIASEDTAQHIQASCGQRTRDFQRVAKADGKQVTNNATYKRSPHAFIAYFLARDDQGTYYFVDQGRYDDNNKMFRVFIGPRGNLQEQKLTNIVHDSGGDIFATANGQLRLVASRNKTEWVRSDKHQVLTEVPISDNLRMIYVDLGVYKQLRFGTPCDDL